jgi:hypothetical protein
MSGQSRLKVPNFEVVRSETDLFKENTYDISVQQSIIAEYFPTTTLNDASTPITFQIQGNDVQYLDLSESALYVRGKFVDKTGGAVPAYTAAGIKVAPVNNLLHSLFEQCTLFLNEKQVSSTSTLYAYRAYLETVLAFSGDYADTQGAAAYYFKDKTNSDPTSADFKVRQDAITTEFDMVGRPHLDFFAQTRYLLPAIDVRLQLHRSPEKFYLLCDAAGVANEYRFVITQAKLLVKKCTILPQILSAHLRHLDAGSRACYPLRSVEMKSYTLPQGTVQNTNENVINGLLPDRLIVALVPTIAVHGGYDQNPFGFGNCGLGSIVVSANGDQVYRQEYQVNFDQNQCVEPFYYLFEALGVGPFSEGPHITLDEFKNGKTFFVFNIRDIKEDFCVPRYGNVRIDLKFHTATPYGLTVLLHTDNQGVLYIDKNKAITFKDYTPTNS